MNRVPRASRFGIAIAVWQTPYRRVRALYQIDTQSVPTSQRFIDWGEPGIASPALQVKPAYGVPY